MDKKLTLRKLNRTFAPRGKKDAPASYGHPHQDQILAGMVDILNQTEIGQMLVSFMQEAEIKVKIMPDKVETGYIPSGKIAYVTAPVSVDSATPRIVLNLVRALREAQQEAMGYSRPEASIAKDDFVEKGWEKEEDILYVMCSISYELFKKTGLKDMMVQMNQMGFKNTMQGFVKDMEHEEQGKTG